MSGIIVKSMTCSLCIINAFSSSTIGFTILKSPSRKMNTRMKAVQMYTFGDPSVLQVETNVSIPAPTANQLLVKVRAAGLNPVDSQMRERSFSFVPKLPLILGKEVSGDIIEVGSQAGSHYKPGDRVICCLPNDGGYAEYVVCDAGGTLKLPKHLSYAQGAAVYVAYFTAYRGLVTKLKIKKGELVLVHGASGAVGMAAVQIAKSIGAVVIGTAGTEEGKKMVQDLGADYIVNHCLKNHLNEALSMIPKCKGFNAILENRATTNLAIDLAALGPNGRIAVVGAKENVTIDPRFLIRTEGSVTGVKMSGISEDEWKECADVVTKGMSDGWLSPVVARQYTLDEIQLAHRHLSKKHGHHGKLVLAVS